MKNKFVLINMMGGTRLDFESEDMVKAGSFVISAFIDRSKEWDVKKTDRYTEEEAVHIEGFDNEKGNKVFYLLLTQEVAEKDKEIYKDWKKVN